MTGRLEQKAYGAFMSYSHAADGRLAPRLHSALHRFAKPWYRLRAVRVFRDKTSLSVNPALWPSIEAALRDSRRFVLLASPDAAASRWVRQEVEFWLAHGSPSDLLIVWTDGQLRWDPQAVRFDPGSTAIPPQLFEAFGEEPLHLDLRWAKQEDDLSLANPRFRDAVADLASALHRRPKDELIGEDVRQHRRTRRMVGSAIVALTVLTVASIVAAFVAVRQGAIAARQRNLAVARQLTAQAQHLATGRGSQLESSVLLAVESMRRFQELGEHPLETDRILRRQAALLTRRTGDLDLGLRSPPRDARFDAAGEVLLILGEDHEAGLWRAAGPDDSANVASFSAPGGIALSADGQRMAARMADVVVVWEGARQLAELHHHDPRPTMAFSPDGRLLGTVDEIAGTGFDTSMAVRVWSLDGGVEVSTMVHPEDVNAVEFSPDGERLATGSGLSSLGASGKPRWQQPFGPGLNPHDDRARVWDVDGGEEIASVWHTNYVQEVAFTPDGKFVASASADNTILIWEAESGHVVLRLVNQGELGTMSFSPDGTYLAATSGSLLPQVGAHVVTVWEMATGKIVGRLEHDDWIAGLRFSPDGTYLVTASRDGTARIWHLGTGTEVSRLVHGDPVIAAAFDPDGDTVSSVAVDGRLRFWALHENDEHVRIGAPGNVFLFAFDAGGGVLATASDSVVKLWRLSDGQELERFDVGEFVIALRHAGSDNRLMMLGLDGNLIEHGSHGDVRRVNVAEPLSVRAHALSADGRMLALVDAHGTARLVGTADGETILELPDDSDVFAFGPHGEALATGHGKTGTVRLWDIAGRRRRLSFSTPRPVTAMAYDSTGRRLASGDAEGTIRLWDPATGRELQRISQDDTVTRIALAPSGDHVATTGTDRATRIWNLRTGLQVAALWHDTPVTGIAFSPDGRRLATTTGGAFRGFDHPVHLWHWKTADLMGAACGRVARNLTHDEWQKYLGDEPYRETCPGSDALWPIDPESP